MQLAPESRLALANRHEWRDGNTRTRTSGAQSIVSPPDTGRSCPSATVFARSTRIVSYEPTTSHRRPCVSGAVGSSGIDSMACTMSRGPGRRGRLPTTRSSG